MTLVSASRARPNPKPCGVWPVRRKMMANRPLLLGTCGGSCKEAAVAVIGGIILLYKIADIYLLVPCAFYEFHGKFILQIFI